MIILGIDPGLRKTGIGIIEYTNRKVKYVSSATITTTKLLSKKIAASNEEKKHAFIDCIREITFDLHSIIEQYQPDVVAMEETFVNINARSSLMLGQARGAAIAICVFNKLNVYSYTPTQIKKCIAGHGGAQKEQVAYMVKQLLKIKCELAMDASDALGAAITYTVYA